MNVKAQVAAVIDLDRCLECRACDIACKAAWTRRQGMDHAWWNHTETRPGPGYPRGWEARRDAGWKLDGGRLRLGGISKAAHFLSLLHQPDLPDLDAYGEPWRFPARSKVDVETGRFLALPHSTVTGLPVSPPRRPDLGSGPGFLPERAAADASGESAVEPGFPLPRLCNHCLNPACVAACPSGAAHKREEDGVVLIDQDRCRGWRACVSACPYGKVDVNWLTGKSEKCHACYPLLEQGRPPICFAACPGQVRFMGVLLYDAERIRDTAELPEEDLVDGLQGFFLDPCNPLVESEARRSGLSEATLEAARHSPVHLLVSVTRVALPLHPEYRTLPAVFYLPPFSRPVANPELASLLGAGREAPVQRSLERLREARNRRRNTGEGSSDGMSPAAGVPSDSGGLLARLLFDSSIAERVVLPPFFTPSGRVSR